jgi:hypothetical protein
MFGCIATILFGTSRIKKTKMNAFSNSAIWMLQLVMQVRYITTSCLEIQCLVVMNVLAGRGGFGRAPSSSTWIKTRSHLLRRKFVKNQQIIQRGGFLMTVQHNHNVGVLASMIINITLKPWRERTSQNAKSMCSNSPSCRFELSIVLPLRL